MTVRRAPEVLGGVKMDTDLARYRKAMRLMVQDPHMRADIQMTQAIVEVAKPLGIAVHDHIIAGRDGVREPQGTAALLSPQSRLHGALQGRPASSRRSPGPCEKFLVEKMKNYNLLRLRPAHPA
jgi:hypothetical protein